MDFGEIWKFLTDTGPFLIPLALCSVLAVTVIIERLFALRPSQVIPGPLQHLLMAAEWEQLPLNDVSATGRLVAFCRRQDPDIDTLKAYAHIEIVRLERGLFILDIIVAAAPLLGLLGTITGLVQVFGGIDPAVGLPDAVQFVGGIAMALSTTLIGLAISLPAMIGSGLLHRRAEVLAAQLNVAAERLIEIRPSKGK